MSRIVIGIILLLAIIAAIIWFIPRSVLQNPIAPTPLPSPFTIP